ncbi:testis-specific gene A8 protein-like isoform X2 [Setaria italica]|uniref:testis-specific gene A8 protein-like isoform X2 n=1 Tax=Setaria italica TaxID=4555 RepID=UPI000BE5993E|nr:testis-specific gene A8 protein-like isoform X2 [Setaria italica]
MTARSYLSVWCRRRSPEPPVHGAERNFLAPSSPTAHLDRGRWMLSSVQCTAGAYNLLIPERKRSWCHRDTDHNPPDRSWSEVSRLQASLMDPSTSNAGAGASVVVAVAAPAAAPPPARPRAAAAPPALSPLSSRAAAAATLFVLGCASTALALLALSLNPADAGFLGPCAPTGQAAANLRASSVLMLLAVAALALAGTVAVLAPARPFAPFACALGAVTAYAAVVVLPRVVACHGHGHGAIAVYYGLFVAMLCAALFAAVAVAVAGDH